MKWYLYITLLFSGLVPCASKAQQVVYSDYDREDSKDINFEIIGKMNGNFLVYKNIRWKHRISIFDNDMKEKETVNLDFVPEKTFNVDFIAYPGYVYMIYQYQKKNILHCMGVKLDADAKKMSEPVEMDTTQIPFLADNKIYTTICSEDKQKIMVFKIQKKEERYTIVTLLFDNQLQLIHKTRQEMPFDERHDNYGDFLVDNAGNFVLTKDSKAGARDYSSQLGLLVKSPLEDTFALHPIDLNKRYIDEVRLKIDNLNNRYIINTFFYGKSRGTIDGLFTYTWDNAARKDVTSHFIVLSDSLKSEAKSDGQIRFALADFFIRQVFVKKDGGFLLTAEDYSTQTRGSNTPWNRWDYFNSPFTTSPYYYSYNRFGNFYRPYNNNNNQSTRYYYANVVVVSIDATGNFEWGNVIHKDQFDDDNDNFLSYTTMNSGGEIHFIFCNDNKHQVIDDHSITPGGEVKLNPTLKSQERGYEFMPRLSKQVGNRQLIMPCAYRGYICFAKVDF